MVRPGEIVADAIMTKTTRAIHLTFQKCGSQWVAQVLGDPEISALTGVPFHLGGVDLAVMDWPQQPVGSFMAPVYGAGLADWQAHRGPGDKAVVVIRDPRDLAISLVYSLSYSHWPGPIVTLLRDILLPMDLRSRIFWGMEQVIFKSKALSSWVGNCSSETELVVRYEDLVATPEAGFARVFSFLGWDVPQDMLQRVVKRHSFAERSGRLPGQEDIFSHYRKGQAGDWKRHFDRDLGRIWEEVMPGLVRSLGYESDDRWYEGLPVESGVGALPEGETQLKTAVELQAEIARMREENVALHRVLAACQEHCVELERQLLQRQANSGINS